MVRQCNHCLQPPREKCGACLQLIHDCAAQAARPAQPLTLMTGEQGAQAVRKHHLQEALCLHNGRGRRRREQGQGEPTPRSKGRKGPPNGGCAPEHKARAQRSHGAGGVGRVKPAHKGLPSL